jgi:hypothetical protein
MNIINYSPRIKEQVNPWNHTSIETLAQLSLHKVNSVQWREGVEGIKRTEADAFPAEKLYLILFCFFLSVVTSVLMGTK